MIITSRSSQKWSKKYEPHMRGKQVWAIGGGQVAEEGKLVASHLHRELIVVPANLSCDAFFTDSVAVRMPQWNKPDYQKMVAPKKVIYDEDILRSTPLRYNVSGWADILSSITARLTLSTLQMNQYKKELKEMDKLIDGCCYPNDEKKRRLLFNSLQKEVDICNGMGSSIIEEGLEHEVAYRLEKKGPGFLHGELVYIGIWYVLDIYGGSQIKLIESLYKLLSLDMYMKSWSEGIGRDYIKDVVRNVFIDWEKKRCVK